MMIKTADGEKNVASKGLGGAALGLAIPGTVALLNQWSNGNGGLGGLFGNTTSNTVTDDTRRIAELEAYIAKEKAERYADGIGLQVYTQLVSESKEQTEKASSNFNTLAAAVAEIDKKVAVDFAVTNCRIGCNEEKIAQLQSLTKLVVPNDSVCPGWGAVTVK